LPTHFWILCFLTSSEGCRELCLNKVNWSRFNASCNAEANLRVRVCARRRSDWGTYDWRFRNEQTSASIAACGSDLRRHNLARKIAARTTKRGNCQALLGFNHMHWLAAVLWYLIQPVTPAAVLRVP